MARPLRIEFPGALYHITSRGNRRESIYDGDEDRRLFLNVLESAIGRFNWICHAYCLMGNHYHLLIETPDATLSAGMREVNGVYTQRFNRRHGRVGHVFQGRYKAVLVEKEPYFLEVCRYIVLNPVRAGMVDQAQQWAWSSYGATSGLCTVPAFLTTDDILLRFSSQRSQAQAEYRRFVREGLEADSPFQNTAGGLVLGGDAFLTYCRSCMEEQSLTEVIREERFFWRPSLAELFAGIAKKDKDARNAMARKAFTIHGYTMKAIADFLGLHYSTVSVILKR